jgi:hypothetical protein
LKELGFYEVQLAFNLNVFEKGLQAIRITPIDGLAYSILTFSTVQDTQAFFPHAHSISISLNKTAETLTLTVNNREEDLYIKNIIRNGYKLIDSVVPKNNNEHAAWKFAHADGKITVLRTAKSKQTLQTTYKITKNFHITKYQVRSYYTQLSI